MKPSRFYSSKYKKILAWSNIASGAFFILIGLVSVFLIFVQNPLPYEPPSLVANILGFLLSFFLIYSGLFTLKMHEKSVSSIHRYNAWFLVFLGTIGLLDTVMLAISSLPVNLYSFYMVYAAVFTAITAVSLLINGLYLRKVGGKTPAPKKRKKSLENMSATRWTLGTILFINFLLGINTLFGSMPFDTSSEKAVFFATFTLLYVSSYAVVLFGLYKKSDWAFVLLLGILTVDVVLSLMSLPGENLAAALFQTIFHVFIFIVPSIIIYRKSYKEILRASHVMPFLMVVAVLTIGYMGYASQLYDIPKSVINDTQEVDSQYTQFYYFYPDFENQQVRINITSENNESFDVYLTDWNEFRAYDRGDPWYYDDRGSALNVTHFEKTIELERQLWHIMASNSYSNDTINLTFKVDYYNKPS